MSTPQDRFLAITRRAENPVENPENEEEEESTVVSRFTSIVGERTGELTAPGRYSTAPLPKDVGVGRAFVHGIKEGILDPLSIVGREEKQLPLDETSEEVASAVGNFIGLGIGFIPFVKGTGLVLRGVGLANGLKSAAVVRSLNAAGEIVENYPMYDFVKYALGGTIQGAATVESTDELPGAIALGLAAGVTIDGFFLTRALRNRTTALGGELRKVDELIAPETASNEFLAIPNPGDSVEKIQAKMVNLSNDKLSLEQAISNLSKDYEETLIFPKVNDIEGLMSHVQTNRPNAQVVLRKSGEGVDVLIHDALTPENRLSTKQIDQWIAEGVMEDLGVLYGNKLHRVTGQPASEGRIQIQSLEHPSAVFAPLRSEIQIPGNPRVLSQNVLRYENLRQIALRSSKSGFVGITKIAGGQGGIRRGVVNTSEYVRVKNMKQFVDQNLEAISRIGSPTPAEDIATFTRRAGIKGVIEVEEDVISNINVFDQSTVSYIKEPPRPNIGLDKIVTSPTGEVISFVPSWKNAIAGPLRQQGIPEKEINTFLERYAADVNERVATLMDPEIQAARTSSMLQYYSGCF